jgi:hypothetical protein
VLQRKKVTLSFVNDYKDVYHLSLIIYTTDDKNETRVSDVKPGETKSYVYPAGTQIFIADWKQEEYAMKGNDIKQSGAKPYIALTAQDDKKVIQLSAVSVQKNGKPALTKPNANDAQGTRVIDLRSTPDNKPF